VGTAVKVSATGADFKAGNVDLAGVDAILKLELVPQLKESAVKQLMLKLLVCRLLPMQKPKQELLVLILLQQRLR